MNITTEQWYGWKQDLVTKELLKGLMKRREGQLEDIAHGVESGLEQIYIAIGKAQGLEEALHYLVEDVKDELINQEELDNG